MANGNFREPTLHTSVIAGDDATWEYKPMSKVSTLSQAAGILTLLDEQKLDLDQIQVIRLYLTALTKGLKTVGLPDIETFRAITEGRAKVEVLKCFIDFDKPPTIPHGWAILPDHEQLPNRVKGVMEFDSAKVRLHLDRGQLDGKAMKGNELRESLKKTTVYGAQLGDFYYANQHLIPPEWKEEAVFFWGTIYRDSDGNLYVRHLYWGDGAWNWDYYWIVYCWDDSNPAAVPAS